MKKTTKVAKRNQRFQTDLVRLKAKSLCTWNRFQRMTGDEKATYLQEILKSSDEDIIEMLNYWKLSPKRFNQQLEIYDVEGRRIQEPQQPVEAEVEIKKELKTTVDPSGVVTDIKEVEVKVAKPKTSEVTDNDEIDLVKGNYPLPIHIRKFILLTPLERKDVIENIFNVTTSEKNSRELLTGISSYSWRLISNIYGNKPLLPRKIKRNLAIARIERTYEFAERQQLLADFYKSCGTDVKTFGKKLELSHSTATNLLALYAISMVDGSLKDIEELLKGIANKSSDKNKEEQEMTQEQATEVTSEEQEMTAEEENMEDAIEAILPKIMKILQDFSTEMLDNEIQEKIIKLKKLGKNEELIFNTIKRICSRKYVTWFRNNKMLFCCDSEKDPVTNRRKLFNQASFEEGMSFVLVNTKVGYVPKNKEAVLEEAAITSSEEDNSCLKSNIKIPQEVLDAVATSQEQFTEFEEVGTSPEAANSKGEKEKEAVKEETPEVTTNIVSVEEAGVTINNIDMSVTITSKTGIDVWADKMKDLIDCLGDDVNNIHINVVTDINITK